MRNYRSGLLRNARRWNFDHNWFLVVGCFHTGCGWLCRAGNGKGSSAVLGIGICQRSHAAKDSAVDPKNIRFQQNEFAATPWPNGLSSLSPGQTPWVYATDLLAACRATIGVGVDPHTTLSRTIGTPDSNQPRVAVFARQTAKTKRIRTSPLASGLFNETAQTKSPRSLRLRSTLYCWVLACSAVHAEMIEFHIADIPDQS